MRLMPAQAWIRIATCAAAFLMCEPPAAVAGNGGTNSVLDPGQVLDGLRAFYQKTARPDGSFAPGCDPAYAGMSDCAYSDLATVTYAVTIHKSLGWKLPFEKQTQLGIIGSLSPCRLGLFIGLAKKAGT
jgi:hypothetical protein